MNPVMKLFVGPMMGSKTTMLLFELERYRYQHKTFALFKPEIDNRYHTTNVVTHAGWSAPAINVTDGADLLKKYLEMSPLPQAVAVDEAFMLKGVAKALTWLFQNNVSILVSSLDLSASCVPFSEVLELMPWATEIKKCPAVCAVCANDAFYTYKKVFSDSEIEIGGSELYEPRCHKHHPTLESIRSSGEKF